MPKKTIHLIILLLFTVVGVAQAQVSITYSSRGKQLFTMIVADDWKINVGSEVELSQASAAVGKQARLLSAMPNDGMPLWFGMWVPEKLKKIKGAREYMDSLGLELLTDMVTTKRNFDTLNSMDVFYVSGTGKKEDEDMDFHAAFVQLSPENVAIAIYIGPPETTNSHGDELVKMIQSLQPVIQ